MRRGAADVLDALAKPRTSHVDDGGGGEGDRGEGGEGGGVEVGDERSGGQRYHDALLELALRVLRSGDLPESGGTPASVIITVPATRTDNATETDAAETDTTEPDPTDLDAADTVGSPDWPVVDSWPVGDCGPVSDSGSAGDSRAVSESGSLIARLAGVAQLGDGTLVRLERLSALLNECDITAVTLTASGGIADYGRERRTATPAMRRALTARDGGCAFPGCDRPASWTEAHHVIPWLDGGPTSLANLCLLCAHHHRAFGPAGWQVIMRDGVPTWIPPAWLDPAQRPVVNTSRHLAKITFAVPTPGTVMRT